MCFCSARLGDLQEICVHTRSGHSSASSRALDHQWLRHVTLGGEGADLGQRATHACRGLHGVSTLQAIAEAFNGPAESGGRKQHNLPLRTLSAYCVPAKGWVLGYGFSSTDTFFASTSTTPTKRRTARGTDHHAMRDRWGKKRMVGFGRAFDITRGAAHPRQPRRPSRSAPPSPHHRPPSRR